MFIDLMKSHTNFQNLFSYMKLFTMNLLLVPLLKDHSPFPFFVRNATGFVQVMENLESHGILWFHFPGLESPGKWCWLYKYVISSVFYNCEIKHNQMEIKIIFWNISIKMVK